MNTKKRKKITKVCEQMNKLLKEGKVISYETLEIVDIEITEGFIEFHAQNDLPFSISIDNDFKAASKGLQSMSVNLLNKVKNTADSLFNKDYIITSADGKLFNVIQTIDNDFVYTTHDYDDAQAWIKNLK